MRFFLLLITVIFSLQADNLRYSGSSTIGRTFFPTLAKKFQNKTSNKFVSIQNPGSGKGVAALINNQTDITGISSPISSREREANLRFFIIGYDAIAIVLHKSNPISSLTQKEIADIFSGRIQNWSEVGGEDLPIEVVVEFLEGKRATQIVFNQIIFGTKNLQGIYGGNLKELDLPLEMAQYVAKTPGAIAPVSMSFANAVDGLKAIGVNGVHPTNEAISNGSYPISRPLILLTKAKIKPSVRSFLEFVYSPEAQSIINEQFVSARGGK